MNGIEVPAGAVFSFWSQIGRASRWRGYVAGRELEHRPVRLLEAVARGIPVVATEACGLRGVTGVVEIPTGDLDALRDALSKLANLGTR